MVDMARTPFVVLVSVGLTAACGSSKVTAPDTTAVGIVALGAQVLRITIQSPCTQFARGVFPIVYTRVTVARGSSEWVATAAGAAAGDVQVRFRQSGTAVIAGSMPVAGSITGTAIHMPELTPLPPWDLRATFSGTGSLTGVAFAAGALNAGTAGLDGVGSGPWTATDGAGNTCTGTAFSWSIFPPP
jgi:hypothetical protein